MFLDGLLAASNNRSQVSYSIWFGTILNARLARLMVLLSS